MRPLSSQVVTLAIALLGSGMVFAARAAEPVVTNPSWLKKPTGENVANYYPSLALDRSISGSVVLSCGVRIDTRLENCSVVSEWPYGMGFGEAASRVMLDSARFRPRTVDGKPTGDGQIRIPFKFIAPTPSARFVILDPIWAAAPSFEAMEAVWPKDAKVASPATVVMRCMLVATGSLRDCTFGADSSGGVLRSAAKALIQEHFRMRMTPEEAKTYSNSDVVVSLTFLDPASPEGRKRTVREPQWITTIDPEKLLAIFPQQAAEAGVKAGRGIADCLVAPDGQLTDCKAGRETPPGLGFGASAVAVASLMRMNPWTRDGRPVAGARIRLPIDFNLSPEDGAAAAD